MTPAESLSERIDALAAALREAGVAPERIASILGTAATATMYALMLDELTEEGVGPRAAQGVQPMRMAA
jgi:coenzyme F420-reducing hydrogenase delta subunit